MIKFCKNKISYAVISLNLVLVEKNIMKHVKDIVSAIDAIRFILTDVGHK